MRSSPSTACGTPAAARPAATAAKRSDSLTRSSCSPRMRVVPSAKAAATARIGYSSIMAGARSGRAAAHLRGLALGRQDHALETARPHPQIGDRLAALLAIGQALDPGAHLKKRADETRAER